MIGVVTETFVSWFLLFGLPTAVIAVLWELFDD